MSAERLLSSCSKVRSVGPGEWIACCPAHEDKSPSLTVKELEDGTILAHCFAGCSIEEITLAAGMHIGELFPDRPKQQEHREPLKRAFNAHAVLDAIAAELQVAYVICGDVYKKKEISRDSHARLGLCMQRLHEAKRLANG